MKRSRGSKTVLVPGGGRSAVSSEARWSIVAAAGLGALLLVAAFLLAASAGAQEPIDDGDPNGGCVDEGQVLITALRTTGAYLPGATIGIQVEPPIISMRTRLPTNPRFCRVFAKPVPTGNWRWDIVERPAGSTSQVVGGDRLKVTFLLDRAGVYRIRFSACPSGCGIKLPDQTIFTVAPNSREVVVRVLAILPPHQLPVLPRSAATATSPTSVPDHCSFQPDLLSAAWRTVRPWSGANDYRLLEGEVVESVVSAVDNDLNHYSQDWNIEVRPDPKYRELLNRNSAGQNQVEVEWERDYLPETYRPTRGDRVSAIGYWIYDCDHKSRSEIHPPVLLAAHRPRTVALPAEFGTNAYVPGIVTDVWVNREAGGGTDDCPGTGLRQQTHPSKPAFDAQGRPIRRCLPDSEGFSSNPINRVFEFNIYLPMSPQEVMAAVGKKAPPVPLYKAVSNPGGSGGPDPVVELITNENVPYLKVRIDLTTYTRQTYSRRIVAAWGHAAPDNWGARRWNVRVNSMNITDDTDPNPFTIDDDGDWRFWVNTNNGTSEWAKLFDCGGCAHGNETFDGRPWMTNSVSPDRSLGADIVLFPNQHILLNTTGFDEDFTFEDRISPLSLTLAQAQVQNGSATANDNSGKYTMRYQVLPGAEVGRAQLTPAAQARYDAYSLTNNDLRGLRADVLALLDASFSAGTRKPAGPTVPSVEKPEREPWAFEALSVKQLSQNIQRAQRERPAELDAFFRDVDRFIQRGKKARREEKVLQFLKALKPTVPAALWRRHGLEEQMRALQN